MKTSKLWIAVAVLLVAAPGAMRLALAQAAPAIGVYTSAPRTFSTASYWIEGVDGAVLIDTQFLPGEGIAAVGAAERATGKKVGLAIVLHPNPDKFNGTAALQARGIRVITSKQVAEAIAGVHRIRVGWYASDFRPDYPREAARPEVFGDRTAQLDGGGLHLILHVLGPGCSAAHVVVQSGDAVFVGDLINPDNHGWLEMGTIDEWLMRLEEIRAMKPARIYPGRGKAGGIELIDRQAAYLRFVQRAVQARNPSGSLSFLNKFALSRQIEAAYPDLGLPLFMRDGLEGVWRVEAAKRGPEQPASQPTAPRPRESM